jgi:hypothetical protein
MKGDWSRGVVGAFAAFVVIILGLVVFAMTREVDLVMDHPYERGLEYDGRIRAMERTAELAEGVEITSTPEEITLRFPQSIPRPLSGSVTLYRPSNRRSDFTVPAVSDSGGLQHITVGHLDRGLWRVRVAWTLNSQEFYSEQPVMLR